MLLTARAALAFHFFSFLQSFIKQLIMSVIDAPKTLNTFQAFHLASRLHPTSHYYCRNPQLDLPNLIKGLEGTWYKNDSVVYWYHFLHIWFLCRSQWKEPLCKIPIFKKAYKLNPAKYCPVILLSITSKLYAKHIY